ncbi:MAG: hypothetical protein JWN43_3229, partial [Gammaproteobacteria bacterium]|nr:hypothetical protein [Gammaproteobacteria bacterium]
MQRRIFRDHGLAAWASAILFGTSLAPSALALEKPEVTYKVFQFPADKIPRIDG